MSECRLLTPDQLEELLAAGWRKLSGPHTTEGECDTACAASPPCITDCGDPMPEELAVTVSGVAVGTCANCADLNTTYTLLWDGPESTSNPNGPCSWSAPVPDSGCGSDVGRMRLVVTGGVPTLTMPIGANGAIEATLSGTWTVPGTNTFTIAEELLGGYCTGTVEIEVVVPSCGGDAPGETCSDALLLDLDTTYGPYDSGLGSTWFQFPGGLLTGTYKATIEILTDGNASGRIWPGPDCDNLGMGNSVALQTAGTYCVDQTASNEGLWLEIDGAGGSINYNVTLSSGGC